MEDRYYTSTGKNSLIKETGRKPEQGIMNWATEIKNSNSGIESRLYLRVTGTRNALVAHGNLDYDSKQGIKECTQQAQEQVMACWYMETRTRVQIKVRTVKFKEAKGSASNLANTWSEAQQRKHRNSGYQDRNERQKQCLSVKQGRNM
ncbi:hypothetical protein NDU88_007055 [Pleurodeles waltl]|uniref:Uncharacterized protein n=1 Tax=Pleurodeles waltl TaxID=8319 RepID=A0AAV7NS06_PLEWA|nr:hypothetical protein NDU88_007055 [Pleurodeles waltl]